MEFAPLYRSVLGSVRGGQVPLSNFAALMALVLSIVRPCVQFLQVGYHIFSDNLSKTVLYKELKVQSRTS